MESQPPEQRAKTSSERPRLTPEQENLVFKVTGSRVAAAVRSQPPGRLDEQLGQIATTPVLGAFVSLKRAGQLRSCCGFLGQSVPLGQALEHAAVRAAKDDPRFPPISPTELDQLDMDVWILWNLEPITERGEERVRAVEIGKHGLQISRGSARGLLLPGVPVEHHWDAEEFLRHVCLKAGLPPEAWKDDDATLMRFEGYAIQGQLDPGPAPADESYRGGPTASDVTILADFCRQNLVALALGATPSFYCPSAFDGAVNGLSLTVRLAGRPDEVGCSRLNLLSDMPLQASAFELVKTLAGTPAIRRLDSQALGALRLDLCVLWDPAMHGTVGRPKLQGLDTRRRAILVSDRSRWVCVYDPQESSEEVLKRAVEQFRLPGVADAEVYSLAVVSTEPRVMLSNVPRPQPGPPTRQPAVAGRFYPADPAEVQKTLDQLLPHEAVRERWAGAMVPHAGWVYSGRLAASVLSRVQIPSCVIVVAPKHNPHGADWAVAPHRTWLLPGLKLESDPELARRLAEAVAGLELDAAAHQFEHSIEVQLPILARLAPDTRVVGIVLHGGDLDSLERFSEQMAGVLRQLPEQPLLLISTDMNHYANDAETRRLDRLALDAVERLDPEALYHTVREKRISMCGMLPAVLVLKTLRRLNSLNRCEVVGYATSADASGDKQHVVGYAGMLFA